jgi:hypothetical protein
MMMLAALGWLGAGCQSSSGPGQGSLATVTIADRSLPQIAEATRAVFVLHGYSGGRSGPLQMTFQKPGSRMDTLAYGDLLNKNVTVRAVVAFQELEPGNTLVTCDAEYLENPGDAIFQDTHKVRRLGKGPYQEMLEEIAKRLK